MPSQQHVSRIHVGFRLNYHFNFSTNNKTAIIFVYAYHPLSKTLADEHFGPNPRYLPPRHPQGGPAVPEPVLWSYMVQIANALRTIHGNGLAARVIDASKILLTSKMRYDQCIFLLLKFPID